MRTCISYIRLKMPTYSFYFLISYSRTPEGVGKVQAGDTVECGLESEGKELATLVFSAVDRVGGYEFKA